MSQAPQQIKEVEGFFRDILEHRLVGDSAIPERGSQFFGVQGPWYTLGYRMWSEVERRMGRERVISDVCRPAQLLLDYNRVTAGVSSAPRWSSEFTRQLQRLLTTRQ
jgi:hypothetical protein